MWANITFCGFASLTGVLATWSARIGLSRSATPSQRQFAWKLFRAVWASGTVTITAGLVKLHETGLLPWTAEPPP